jgi:hypothetical protein
VCALWCGSSPFPLSPLVQVGGREDGDPTTGQKHTPEEGGGPKGDEGDREEGAEGIERGRGCELNQRPRLGNDGDVHTTGGRYVKRFWETPRCSAVGCYKIHP